MLYGYDGKVCFQCSTPTEVSGEGVCVDCTFTFCRDCLDDKGRCGECARIHFEAARIDAAYEKATQPK